METRVVLEELTVRLPHLRPVADEVVRYHENACFHGPVRLWVDNPAPV